MPSPEISSLRAAFDPVPGYLNVASMGLPTRDGMRAMTEALANWQQGGATPPGYDEHVRASRTAYAELVGVRVDAVAVGPTVSVMLAPVAASLPDGARVLVPLGDFASVLFPFLVHADRGVRVDQVPLEELAERIGPSTDLVAFSLVQSADGRRADVTTITEACRQHGALSVCDTTQASGWLPVPASRCDVTVCAAYKWLCSPRGAAFATFAEPVRDRFRPVSAGWYAGEQVWESIYGPEMSLAGTARRFDISPAWLAWVGAAATLPLFAASDPGVLHRHGVGLAARLRAELGLPEIGSAIVAVPDPDGSRARRLAEAGCSVARRAGAVRLGFHLWNDEDDLDRAIDSLRPPMHRQG